MHTGEVRVESLEEARVHIAALHAQVEDLQIRLRTAEKKLDTGWETPLWKRIVFWVDGWPLNRLVDAPAWRPWRSWWCS